MTPRQAAPESADRRLPRTGSWTTRRWLAAGMTGALVVLIGLSLLAVWYFSYATTISNQLNSRSNPALIAAVQLENSLINQETGVRGYAITGQADFLEPYSSGRRQQDTAVAQLRTLTAGDQAATADLDLVIELAERWRHDVAQPIVTAPAGRPVPLPAALTDTGKQEFDALRAAVTLQQEHLRQQQAAASGDLRQARVLRTWLFTAIGLAIIALAALVYLGLRRGINAPLESLSRQLRLVSAGDFTHPIATGGPADLRSVAAEVEAMRRRLVDELAVSHAAEQAKDAYAADLARSNSELEQFAYVASHDLQEPLRKVASFCQLLQRRYADQLDDRANQYIEFAVDGATRMQTLINDLLAFSRVGRLHDAYTPVDLEQIWQHTTAALSIAVNDAGADLRHDPLPVVDGDPTQLGMLLQNLLSNAVKFRAPDRVPVVSLTVEPDTDPGMWRFVFADNGIGIGSEYADRIFVIFQRLHNRDAYPGNGIGLALCKKIVEYHGGTITLDTTAETGTRFAFTLPRHQGAELPEPAVVPDAEAS
ncbi:signal transduction histidine kinase [Allocatelliglobosispora scoriae]|uniref:histidine kinase n=1 Tax=Allocatelliglobosispora scoriae TaxID=643052 RepID=A0A841BHQ5_9ACTN|nr:sensor histidine kinase [Allocatelliglobosispora scoriae]MBB5867814.1 signal transduction histidine kinase [Allocatelliglobosispora scoriae]